MIIKMTRKEALEAGLLTCNNCGHPVNNHFDFGRKTCAHCRCKGYEEISKYGKIIKKRLQKWRNH